LRNALATFGPVSPQYVSIKYMVDDYMAKASSKMQEQEQKEQAKKQSSTISTSGHVMNLAFRPKGV